jgi:V/A-type H+-transporting ATPase subunit E
MDARKTILAAKQEMVDEAYALALDKLCKMPEGEKVKLLADLLVRASSGGTEEAIFSEADRAVGEKAVKAANESSGKKLTLSKETAPIRGGFILRDQNVEVNCAFETLVRLQKAETAGAVAKLLFQ